MEIKTVQCTQKVFSVLFFQTFETQGNTLTGIWFFGDVEYW